VQGGRAAGSVLIWILLLLAVCDVQARAVGWDKPNPIFLGARDHPAKWLISRLSEGILKLNGTINNKYNFFEVFPFQELFFRDFNQSHNWMAFAGRDQILTSYSASLITAPMARKGDKNTIQRERQIGGINDIKLDMKAPCPSFWHIRNGLPIRNIYPLLEVNFLQSDAPLRSFSAYSGSFGGFSGLPRLPSDDTACDNSDEYKHPLGGCIPLWRLWFGGLCWFATWGVLYYYRDRVRIRWGLLCNFLLMGGGTLIWATGKGSLRWWPLLQQSTTPFS
jgi:hypothetical protein